MLLVPYNIGTVSYLQYPKHRINYKTTENEVVLEIPSMLTLELFRKGILSSDKDAEIALSISGKKIGKYIIDDFRYPKTHNDVITIKFRKVKNIL